MSCHPSDLVVTGIRGGKKITHLDTSNPPRIHLKEPQGRLEAEPVSDGMDGSGAMMVTSGETIFTYQK